MLIELLMSRSTEIESPTTTGNSLATQVLSLGLLSETFNFFISLGVGEYWRVCVRVDTHVCSSSAYKLGRYLTIMPYSTFCFAFRT